MKRRVSALALTVLLTSSCTDIQIATIERLADRYMAEVQLTATDEYGYASTIEPADVAVIELDGQSIPVSYTADGQLQLPAGDYSRDRELHVRLHDGSDVMMPLNQREGRTRGRAIQFAGAMHRQSGRVVAAEVMPGGDYSYGQRVEYLENVYLSIPINRPNIAGRLRAVGIDQQRLPQEACAVSDSGDLLIHRSLIQQYARQGSRLWAIVDVESEMTSGWSTHSWRRAGQYRPVPNRYALLVLQVHDVAIVPVAPVRDRNGCIQAARPSRTAALRMGRDVSWVYDESNVVTINNVNNYVYNYYGVYQPTPIAAPTASPTPATPTSAPTATPKPHDDNGHGNDPGHFDPSNPGNSG